MVVFISALIQTLVQPMKSRSFLDRIFPFKNVKILPTKGLFYYHIGQCNAHTICHTTEGYWQGLVEDVKNFLNGHDDKIVNQLKAKMKDMSDQMEFERCCGVSRFD